MSVGVEKRLMDDELILFWEVGGQIGNGVGGKMW